MKLGLRDFAFYNLGLGKKVQTIEPSELFAEDNATVTFNAGFRIREGVSPQEGLLLLLLAAQKRCRTVFEIGTCTGLTTYNIARNVPGIIYTLDLPESEQVTILPIEEAEKSFIGVAKPQRFWIGMPEADRIVQLRGDSADFDFTPYYKRMDLVFVDGSHAYHYVRKDSESALAMVQDSGAIVWHDYAPCWPGVVRALNELASRVPLVNLKGTSLVVYRKE